ncbi:hypothetical protein GIB67_006420 [Kingdonia uniflora]|uniref:U3 small nucleolar RNA-associated protein 18 homolog n=1 Tax=Kingdonia uniflora TaxID=39325 RepID=A0A7J7P1H6_9MAGN|nr:hypothetical protein GIB67_006420 [Kingdonia uniflora]
MSLISQNALRKRRVELVKEEEEINDEVFSVEGGDEESGVVKETDLVGLKSSNKKRKKGRGEGKQLVIEQEEEMKRLEGFLFGSLDTHEFGNEDGETGGEVDDENGETPLFFNDLVPNREVAVYEGDEDLEEGDSDEDEEVEVVKHRKPVWVDDEEEKTNIDIAKVGRLRKLRKKENETMILGSDYVSRLRAQHIKMNPSTDWANPDLQLKNNDESDEENGILTTNEELVEKSGMKLLPGILEHSRLVNANAVEPSNTVINSVQFHRNAQLLLTAGLDRKLRFFQIDGKRNTMIQSFFLEDCPIRKASFLPDGSQVIVGGRRKYFYSFDLVKAALDKIGPLAGRQEKSLENFEVSPDSNMIAFIGDEGHILLVSRKTKELIGTLKMNGTARSLAFADGGQQLLSSGGDGHIYHWDLRTRRSFHKGVDEGCINGSALCTSPNGSMFAAGSGSGIVNVYNREEFLVGKRKPLKVIENLTTEVDFLKFNHDSQMLAICSSMQKNSLKLIHVPSFSVFSNWPPAKHALNYPRCLDFSPGGGFMAMGNAAGKVLLYKLHHYQHA